MPASFDHLSEQDIHLRLEAAQRLASTSPIADFPYPSELLPTRPRPAAVLLPLLRQNDEWHLLLTRRTAHLAEHGDQVAFPGGHCEPDDEPPVITALREAREEIGLLPTDVHILGRIRDYVTITGYQVTPIVGRIPWPYALSLQKDEVSRVFTIPLSWLADPSNRQDRLRQILPSYDPIPVIYFRLYDGELLWGASARFTVTLIDILNSTPE